MGNWEVKDVVAFDRPTGIAMSPDGEKVIYSLRTFDADEGVYREKLWQVGRDELSIPLQLTRGNSTDTDPTTSPDGAWIGFLSDRKQDDDDEDDADEMDHQLYLLPRSGGEAIYASESLSEIYDFAFAPDSQGIYVITDVEETPLDTYMRKSSEEDKRDVVHEERTLRSRRICYIKLPSLEVTTIYERDYGLLQLSISDDGTFLVFVTNYTGQVNDEDRADIWLLKRDADSWSKPSPLVCKTGACLMPAVSPNGKQVAYVAPRDERRELSQSDLFVIDVDTGDTRNITQEAGFTGDVEGVVWATNHALVAATEQGLYAPIVRFEIDVNTYAYVTNQTAVARAFDVAKSAPAIGYLEETVDEPDNIFVASLDGQNRTRCTDFHARHRDLPRARVSRFTWTSDMGAQSGVQPQEMEGILVLPNEKVAGSGPYPMLLDIHGGPAWHTTMSFDTSHTNYHFFASLGYAVFLPNYRGGMGYGHDYIKATFEDLGGGDYRDIIRGVDAVIATGLVDESRMGIVGGSYGGYMTNWIIGHDTRFKAAVSEYGIWNLFTDFGCSSQRAWEMMYLGAYWKQESLYLERSPSRYVENIQTPVLIIHGDADDNTFIANSKEMYNAFIEAGKPVEFVHYPREGHGIQEPRHRIDELERIVAWFSHYIPANAQGTAVPLGESKTIPPKRIILTVDGARHTKDYTVYGEDYESVIEITVTIDPAKLESDDDSVVELQIDDKPTSDVLLGTTVTQAYQRPSVFASECVSPKAVVLSEGTLVTGEISFAIALKTRFRLLFVGPLFGQIPVDDWQLYIGAMKFKLGSSI